MGSFAPWHSSCRLTTEAVTCGSKLSHALFLESADDIVEQWTGDVSVVFAEPTVQVKCVGLSMNRFTSCERACARIERTLNASGGTTSPLK